MAELRHGVGDLDDFGVSTLHSVGVRTVGINSMVGYAIEIPGTRGLLRSAGVIGSMSVSSLILL